MTSTDRLEPWHIKHYLLYTEQVTCRCGHISAHERLWIHYDSNRATTTRPLGLSEQIYAGVEVKHATKEFHTRACTACISSTQREAWSMPTPTPAPERSNVLAQLRASASAGFAASAGYGTTAHKGKGKSLDELLPF